MSGVVSTQTHCFPCERLRWVKNPTKRMLSRAQYTRRQGVHLCLIKIFINKTKRSQWWRFGAGEPISDDSGRLNSHFVSPGQFSFGAEIKSMVGRRAQLVDSDQFVVPSIPEFTNKGFFRPLSCVLSVKLMEHKEATRKVLGDQGMQLGEEIPSYSSHSPS